MVEKKNLYFGGQEESNYFLLAGKFYLRLQKLSILSFMMQKLSLSEKLEIKAYFE